MREFVTAVSAAEDETKEGWVDFSITENDADGKEVRKVPCRAKRPSSGQVAYLTASMHKRAPIEQQIAGAINFCMAIMDTDTAAYMSDRLLDSEDPFELPQIQDIIEGLLEEWTGRPTVPSPDSAQSGDSTGQPSTPVSPTTSSNDVSIGI